MTLKGVRKQYFPPDSWLETAIKIKALHHKIDRIPCSSMTLENSFRIP